MQKRNKIVLSYILAIKTAVFIIFYIWVLNIEFQFKIIICVVALNMLALFINLLITKIKKSKHEFD